MKLQFKSVVVGIAVAAAASQAVAALQTSDEGYAGPFIDLRNFEQIATSPTGETGYTFGPTQLPGMVFTLSDPANTTQCSGDVPYSNPCTNSGNGAVLGTGDYYFTTAGGIGRFNGVIAGLDGPSGFMQFVLTGGPVSEFGAYVNYSPGSGLNVIGSLFGGNPYIAALGADGQVLDNEIYDLAALAPVSASDPLTPFAFRGISRTSADIYGLRLGNAFIVAAMGPDGTLPTGAPGPVPAVPEPQTYTLMLVGLAAVGWVARRRRTLSPA